MLLVFSVDAAEGKTVTFNSYPKADGSGSQSMASTTQGKMDHMRTMR